MFPKPAKTLAITGSVAALVETTSAPWLNLISAACGSQTSTTRAAGSRRIMPLSLLKSVNYWAIRAQYPIFGSRVLIA